MKILILGSNGMLGIALCKVFPTAIHLTRKDLDITDKLDVVDIIRKYSPDVVINATAYTDVADCEKNEQLAYNINGVGPKNIAIACFLSNAMLIHYSTDYIFDGYIGAYTENSTPNPLNVYGKSKLLGENNIKSILTDYKIIRTSWLFGPGKDNFVTKMIELGRQNDKVDVVCDQIGRPTYTKDLAIKTKELIELESGIYHVTNGVSACSWYKFATSIITNAVPCETNPNTSVTRPDCSILLNSKITRLRSWQEALKEYLEELNI